MDNKICRGNIPELTKEEWEALKEYAKDDLLPMEQWDGGCWKTMFDWFAETLPEVDPWDSLAAFIKLSLMKEDNNEQET